MNKKIFIIFSIVVIILIIIFVFINKKIKIGNNITSQEKVNNILNLNSYKATIEVNIKSNKNENKYIIKQKYKKDQYLEQEVVEPSNISGVKIIKQGTNLKIENTKLNLKSIFEGYKEITENELDLITFINNYKSNEKSTMKNNKESIILETKNSTLYINKKSGKPEKMEIRDTNKKVSIYILYREVDVNR